MCSRSPTFADYLRDGVTMVRNDQGELNLYAVFQFPQSELDSALLRDQYSATRFAPLIAFFPAQDNDDTSGHSLYGGAGNDMLEGGFGSDFIDGGADNDALDGERGDDFLLGGSGDDLILGGEGNDWMDGGDGVDLLDGGDGDDILFGDNSSSQPLAAVFHGNDTLNGGAGNDWLDGGAGADIMAGGAGDDIYVVDDVDDLVIEAAGEGNDSIRYTADVDMQSTAGALRSLNAAMSNDADAPVVITLPDNIEQLSLFGTAAVDGVGNAADNGLWGNLGSNTLHGAAGNDYLFGDAGDDVYLFNRGDGQDSIDNFDILRFGEGIADTDVLGFQVGMDLALTLNFDAATLTPTGAGAMWVRVTAIRRHQLRLNAAARRTATRRETYYFRQIARMNRLA